MELQEPRTRPENKRKARLDEEKEDHDDDNVTLEEDEVEMSYKELQMWIRDQVQTSTLVSLGRREYFSQLQSLLERRKTQTEKLLYLCKSLSAFEKTVKELYSMLGLEYIGYDFNSGCSDAPISNQCGSNATNDHGPVVTMKEAMVVLTNLSTAELKAALRPEPPQIASDECGSLSSAESEMCWEPQPDSSDSDLSDFTKSVKRRKMNLNRTWTHQTSQGTRRQAVISETETSMSSDGTNGSAGNDTMETASEATANAQGNVTEASKSKTLQADKTKTVELNKSNTTPQADKIIGDESRKSKTSQANKTTRAESSKLKTQQANKTTRIKSAKSETPTQDDKSTGDESRKSKTSLANKSTRAESGKSKNTPQDEKTTKIESTKSKTIPQADKTMGDETRKSKTSQANKTTRAESSKSKTQQANRTTRIESTKSKTTPQADKTIREDTRKSETSQANKSTRAESSKSQKSQADKTIGDETRKSESSQANKSTRAESSKSKTSQANKSIGDETSKTKTPQANKTTSQDKANSESHAIKASTSSANINGGDSVSQKSSTTTTDPPNVPLEKITVNMKVLARRKPLSWHAGKVAEIITKEDGRVKYKVVFKEKGRGLVSGHHIAFAHQSKVSFLSVGARVVIESEDSEFVPGIVAEIPSRKNHMRFMVFTDDHTPVYIVLPKIRLVCQPLADPLDDIPDNSHRDFMRNYLRQWPFPPLTHYRVGQKMRALYDGTQQMVEVLEVDCSLVQVIFEEDQHKEWLYRGSVRLEQMVQMIEEMEAKKNDGTVKK